MSAYSLFADAGALRGGLLAKLSGLGGPQCRRSASSSGGSLTGWRARSWWRGPLLSLVAAIASAAGPFTPATSQALPLWQPLSVCRRSRRTQSGLPSVPLLRARQALPPVARRRNLAVPCVHASSPARDAKSSVNPTRVKLVQSARKSCSASRASVGVHPIVPHSFRQCRCDFHTRDQRSSVCCCGVELE